MTREDAKIIFNNVSELAVFADDFADGIEKGECVQPVVRDARAPASSEDFFPDLVLHVRVLGEQLQDLRHHV